MAETVLEIVAYGMFLLIYLLGGKEAWDRIRGGEDVEKPLARDDESVASKLAHHMAKIAGLEGIIQRRNDRIAELERLLREQPLLIAELWRERRRRVNAEIERDRLREKVRAYEAYLRGRNVAVGIRRG